MTLTEKKEMVIQSYKSTFDKDMAYQKINLSPSEIEDFERDEVFQRRLQYYLIREREKVIENMRKFMDSYDDKIAMAATNKFASLIFPDFMDGIRKEKPKKLLTPQDLNMKEKSDEELVEIANTHRPLKEQNS